MKKFFKGKDNRPEEEKRIAEAVDPTDPGVSNRLMKDISSLTYQSHGMRKKVMVCLLKTIRDRMKHDIKADDARAANKV
jgi:hypothetical protein